MPLLAGLGGNIGTQSITLMVRGLSTGQITVSSAMHHILREACIGFFIGTIWDLYQLYDESFKDGDGYPLYSDDSIKSNYRRRRTRASAGLLFKLAHGITSFHANIVYHISTKVKCSRQILSAVPGYGQIMIWPVTI